MPKRAHHLFMHYLQAWQTSTVCPGHELDQAELDAIWRFRISVLPLKESTDVAQDHATLTQFFRDSQLTLRIKDQAGALRGIGAIKLHDLHDGDAPYRWIQTEYFALDDQTRNSLSFQLGALKLGLGIPIKPKLAHYIGGPGYPTSLFFLARHFPPLYMDGDANMPHQVQHLMQHIVNDNLAKWDPQRRIVSMPTRPKPPSQGWLKGATQHGFYPRFIERCPSWQEGYGVPCVVKWSLAQGIQALIKKRLKRAPRAT